MQIFINLYTIFLTSSRDFFLTTCHPSLWAIDYTPATLPAVFRLITDSCRTTRDLTSAFGGGQNIFQSPAKYIFNYDFAFIIVT